MPHGGNINKLKELCGENELLDFSASINPLGAPEWIRREISRNISALSHYPDVECTELIKVAANSFNINQKNIIAANGTSEIIFLLPQILGKKKALVPAPAYIDYEIASKNHGLEVEHYPLLAENNFIPDIPRLENSLTGGEIVFLAHPNNPTGVTLDLEKTVSLIKRNKNSIFIIDEAYLSFCENAESFIPHLLENMIVLRSLTKFYAVPGLRLGLAFTEEKLAQKIRAHLPPWSVNTLAQAVGTRALQDTEYFNASRSNITKLRTDFSTSLSKITGLKVFPSDANFLLLKITDQKFNADILFDKLIRKGFAIRNCANFAGLDNSYIRLAVRSQEDNNALLEALNEIMQSQTVKAPLKRKKTPSLMILGASSNAGKSVLVAGLCRIMLQDGIAVTPFKSQNMALNSYVTLDGAEIGRAQAMQAQAAGLDPDVRMNPVLLKPNSDTGSQVIINGQVVGNMKVREYVAYKEKAFTAAKEAYDSLSSDYDAVILEGAGSPGEVNLKAHDIVNLNMARYAEAPSLLAGDIDRGGVYASFIGTYETFSESERELVKGFIVNRFRGDASLLRDAHEYVKDFTGRDIFGVVPYLKNLGLPEEDSVSFCDAFSSNDEKHETTLDIALLAIPHIANFTDFDALSNEPDVKIRLVRNKDELGNPAAIIIPGSKNVISDMKFLNDSGLTQELKVHAGKIPLIGICGGMQILGGRISDPHNIESGGDISGLGLLPLTTVFAKKKTLQKTIATHKTSNLQVEGYEIHHGVTDFSHAQALTTRSDGVTVGVGDDNIWGTYIHGVFDRDEFRRWFIDSLRVRNNLPKIEKVIYSYDLSSAFDRLADTLRDSLPIDKIYQMMGI